MKIAIENKDNKIGFFKINASQLQNFLKKAQEINNNNIVRAWTYSGIENVAGSIGLYKDVKIIKI
jgi:heterodisulfide reductase subunit A-like polyferredoxin